MQLPRTLRLWVQRMYSSTVSLAFLRCGARGGEQRTGNKRVACIGDALNDLEMLKEADVPVAMGNALPEIKKIASLEVNPNSNSELPGVADLVDRILSS
ncbi:hypothetical protein FOZ63_033665 [Perkinsus olseni]|uniref:Uncharacterized protein n=1 Tax=Perkinsus olseni TaxID=32597 RepID=A0A7J6RXS7_PEROL|nr:hypothetical protein FOZ63_033665 [Perkinsus olseni]